MKLRIPLLYILRGNDLFYVIIYYPNKHKALCKKYEPYISKRNYILSKPKHI